MTRFRAIAGAMKPPLIASEKRSIPWALTTCRIEVLTLLKASSSLYMNVITSSGSSGFSSSARASSSATYAGSFLRHIANNDGAPFLEPSLLFAVFVSKLSRAL